MWFLQKLLQVISGVEISFYIDSFDYIIFKNRTFLVFTCKVGFLILETREFKEFKDFEKVLVKSGILDRLVVISNIIVLSLEL